MPRIPVTGTGRASGTYDAVRRALGGELGTYRRAGPPPTVFRATLAAMQDGLPVAVPAWLLPPWCRPPLRAGYPTPVAVVTTDDRVVLCDETPKETLQWLGLDD
jgi:hypothetical protein